MAYKTIDRRLACSYLKQLKTQGKTPVSLAMELATKLGVVAEFQEAKELKWSTTFKYIVTLGDIKAIGVASSKKEAKQNSAKELIKLIENESESLTPSTPKYQSLDVNPLSFSSPVSNVIVGRFILLGCAVGLSLGINSQVFDTSQLIDCQDWFYFWIDLF